jgi:GntR family transcriptional repressor for pyruvate dehydrogenase complex
MDEIVVPAGRRRGSRKRPIDEGHLVVEAEAATPAPLIESLLRQNHSGDRRQKLAFALAQQIVADIHRRQLAPGDMLPPERDMLLHYGVGRFTLRETLRYLEMQGLITIKPGPGGGPAVSVPEPRYLAIALSLGLQYTGTRFRAVLQTRTALEPVVAAESARNIDSALLAELRDSVEKLGHPDASLDTFLEQNEHFHDIIAWTSGNAIFGYVLSALHWIGDGANLGVRYPDWARKVVYRYHQRIYDAIAARNSAAAYRYMQEHVEQYVVYMEEYYPELMDRIISWERVRI